MFIIQNLAKCLIALDKYQKIDAQNAENFIAKNVAMLIIHTFLRSNVK
jgi:hypothetical protein